MTWSYTLDTFELNDGIDFVTFIPEVDDSSPTDPVLVEVLNDYPWYVRSQPLSRVLNINIQMTPCDWATYTSRLATLRSLSTPGPHTLTVSTRGMTSSKSLIVFVTSFAICDPKVRRVSIQVAAPKPAWF